MVLERFSRGHIKGLAGFSKGLTRSIHFNGIKVAKLILELGNIC